MPDLHSQHSAVLPEKWGKKMNKLYDKEIGYSPLEYVDLGKMRNVIRICKVIVEAHHRIQSGDKILVAGAGEGTEAALLAEEYGTFTVGVDLNIRFSEVFRNHEALALLRQDLTSLGFQDDSFSLIYSYHVLEHIDDPVAALNELSRVLKPDGLLFIGFPNKNRLISYIGTSQKVSLLNRVLWNLNDIRHRLTGRFENKYGAHAGFTEKEFIKSATRAFRCVIPVRNQYMLQKYGRYAKFIQLMITTHFSEFLFPSNYFICKKAFQDQA